MKFYQLCLNVCIEQNNRHRNEGMQSDSEKGRAGCEELETNHGGAGGIQGLG